MAEKFIEKRFQLLKHQYQFIHSEEELVCWIGGVGSGKTDALSMWTARECLEWQGPNFDPFMVVAAASNKQLEMSTIPKFLGRWYDLGIWNEYSDHRKIARFGNGAWLKFQTLDIPAGDLKGSELGAIVFDEVDTCPEEHVKALMGRVRKKGARLLKRMVGNSPPPKHWIEQWFLPIYNRNMGTLLQSTTYDNPFLPKKYVEYLEKIYPAGTPGHRRMILGEMGVAMEGAIYQEFNNDLIIPESYVPWDDIIGYVHGLDLGHNHPTVFLVGAVDRKDNLYIIGEYAAARTLLREHASSIHELYKGGPIYSDHDAQDRLELDDLGLGTTPANKDVLMGIQAVRRRMRDGTLKIVGNHCPRLISELPYYVWGKNEEPVKVMDDACDALRYMVMGYDRPDDSLDILAAMYGDH